MDKLEDTNYEELNADFLDHIIQARRRLMSEVNFKRINRKILDGPLLSQLLINFSEDYNKTFKVDYNDVWRNVCNW